MEHHIMIKGKKTVKWLLLFYLFTLLPFSCDKLDDGGDEAINEVLVGTWSFSYELQSEDDVDLSFSYEQVIFRSDGTCAITYPDGLKPVLDADGNETGEYEQAYSALTGIYRASNAVIRIESSDVGGEERVMLWVIQSFSEKRLTANYDFELDSQPVRAVVTLEKQ